MSPVPLPVLVAASAAAVGLVALASFGVLRQFRLRRHLRRLRMPLDQFGR